MPSALLLDPWLKSGEMTPSPVKTVSFIAKNKSQIPSKVALRNCFSLGFRVGILILHSKFHHWMIYIPQYLPLNSLLDHRPHRWEAIEFWLHHFQPYIKTVYSSQSKPRFALHSFVRISRPRALKITVAWTSDILTANMLALLCINNYAGYFYPPAVPCPPTQLLIKKEEKKKQQQRKIGLAFSRPQKQ